MQCNADYAEHALASPAIAGNLKLNPNEPAPMYLVMAAYSRRCLLN